MLCRLLLDICLEVKSVVKLRMRRINSASLNSRKQVDKTGDRFDDAASAMTFAHDANQRQRFPAIKEPAYLISVNTTRLFFARPALVLLVAIGLEKP